jgi:hypothetical protein
VPPLNARREGNDEDRPRGEPEPPEPGPASVHDPEDVPPWSRRDRFAVSLLTAVAIAMTCANSLGSLLAPGWVGVGSERAVTRWLWWGGVTSIAAAVMGLATIVSLVVAAVPSPRTSISTRLVATFGAGLVVALAAAALGNPAEDEVLLVLAAGTFWVLVAGAVEAVAPPRTRALGLQLSLLALAGLARICAWAIVWNAVHRGHASMLAGARVCATIAIVAELAAAALVVVYVAHRPGVRAGAVVGVLTVLAFGIATWVVRTPQATSGTLRDALQHALSLRVQGTGPLPTWVPLADVASEIKMLEPDHRLAFLPLVFAELLSIALGVAALVGVRRSELPLVAAMALATLSRGQLDTPMRSVALTVAALGAIVLARGARLVPPLESWKSLRPPEQ